MTQFKGTPLFGKDSSPSHTSNILSLIITFVFWALFGVGSIVINPHTKKQDFKEIQIVLAPPEKPKIVEDVEKTVVKEVSPSPVKEVSKTEPQKVEQTTKSKAAEQKPAQSKTVETKKTEPKKTETKPVQKPVPVKTVEEKPFVPLAEDPMEAFNRQTSQKKKTDFDWSQFDDDPVEQTTSETQTTQKVVGQSSISGSAGSIAEMNQKQTSSSQNSSNSNQTVSKGTSSMLGSIEKAEFTETNSAGISSVVSANTVSKGNGTAFNMADGRTRTLINPKEPAIKLSDKASSTIDGNRNVIIKFSVNKQGSVIASSIEFQPASTLSEIVRKEISEQISKWIFEAADFESTASFEYKIIKK